MSITDELREYADTLSERARCGATIPSPFNPHSGAPIGPTRETEELYAIADRIDAEHESKISRAAQLLADAEKDRDFNYANWQDCKQKVLQHNITIDELDAGIERLKDELAHCIELPKDADGEYIHIGDEMEHVELGYVCEVIAVGIDCFIAWNTHANRYCQYDSKLFRHQHEPTVEDVLEEMCNALNDARMPLGSGMLSEEIIAEYAAKLQLKERE